MELSVLTALFIAVALPHTVSPLKCYHCEFNAAFCKGLDCYHNPDICSNNEFSTALVLALECPRNCYTKAVTNPAGMAIKWTRGCAPDNDHTHGFKCRTDYKIGARIEQCTCDKDLCNQATKVVVVNGHAMLACLIFGIYTIYLS